MAPIKGYHDFLYLLKKSFKKIIDQVIIWKPNQRVSHSASPLCVVGLFYGSTVNLIYMGAIIATITYFLNYKILSTYSTLFSITKLRVIMVMHVKTMIIA